MASNLPYMKLYVNDWLTSPAVMAMSPAERGMYLHLLLHQWNATDGRLPLDVDRLARLAGAESNCFSDAWNVLRECFESDENGYYNSRLEEVRKEAENVSESRRKAGKKGGRPSKKQPRKKQTKTNCFPDAKANGKLTESYQNRTEQNKTEHREAGAEPPKRPRKGTVAQSPPTVEEVRGYCASRSNGISAEQFVDHYTANGWKQSNGNPIRDWQAAVRTWERNGMREKTGQRRINAYHDPNRGPVDTGDTLEGII